MTTSRKPDILIDLDDVLVSFRRGAAAAHGWSWEEVERLGSLHSTWHMGDWFGVSHDEFWEPIHAMGEQFWYELELLPWADALLESIRTSGCEWYIATSPSLSSKNALDSYIGKMKFLRGFLGPEDLHRCFVNKNKHKLCHPGDVLIDDSPHNIETFEAKGGRGILFPLLGNSNSHLRHDPLPYVREKLCEYVNSTLT